jgi:hypothetical protein
MQKELARRMPDLAKSAPMGERIRVTDQTRGSCLKATPSQRESRARLGAWAGPKIDCEGPLPLALLDERHLTRMCQVLRRERSIVYQGIDLCGGGVEGAL